MKYSNRASNQRHHPHQTALRLSQINAENPVNSVSLERESEIFSPVPLLFTFWDGLIVAAAYPKNSAIILTEDMNHGQIIEGIRIENPFLD
jgi:predicted nucleic acid-binding protein